MGLKDICVVETHERERLQKWEKRSQTTSPANPIENFGARMTFQMARPLSFTSISH
jgi:hypothetical protein